MSKSNNTKLQNNRNIRISSKPQKSLRDFNEFKDIVAFFDNIHEQYLELIEKHRKSLRKTKQAKLSLKNQKQTKKERDSVRYSVKYLENGKTHTKILNSAEITQFYQNLGEKTVIEVKTVKGA